MRMLGGLVLWITSLYCVAPRRGPEHDKGEKVPGVYVELVQFRASAKVVLQDCRARSAASGPLSVVSVAQQELERDGVRLDTKTVRRIAGQCGRGC